MNEALRKFLIFCLFETNINFSFFRNSKKKLIQENKNMQKLIYNCNAYIVAFLLMFTFFLWLKQQQKKTNISRKVTIYLLQLRSPFYKWGAMEIKMTIKMAVRKQLELCKPYSAIFIFFSPNTNQNLRKEKLLQQFMILKKITESMLRKLNLM